MLEDKHLLNDELLEQTNGGAGLNSYGNILFKTCQHCESKIMINEIASHMRLRHGIENPVQGSDYL